MKIRGKRAKRRGYGFCWLLFLAPAALLLRYIGGISAARTEAVYSRGIYPLISAALSAVFGLFPFSVAELLLIALILWAFWTLLRGLILPFLHGPREFARALLKLASAASAGVFLFMGLWGLNYCREPLTVSMKLKTATPTAQELSALLSGEVSSVNALCGQVTFGKDGASRYEGGFSAMRMQANAGYDWLQADDKPGNRMFGLAPAHPKSVFPANVMAYVGIEGIYIPFTAEPTVDSGYPDVTLPFTLSHETAHFKGFAREDEANFLAYLACLDNPDVYFQYSGHMNAILYLSNALYRTDRTLWQQDIGKLDRRAAGDLDHYSEYVKKHQSGAEKAATRINDSYLKSQGQSGVISYDNFVNLLCDRYRTLHAPQDQS